MAKRTFRGLCLLAALALPATAAQPKEHVHTAALQNAGDGGASFADVAALSTAPEPASRAVDLAMIEPAVELPVATTPLDGGIASYYGRRFHGRPTASGERFDMNAMTAAHRTLPFGSLVEVTNQRTGKKVTVRINDRGPFHSDRVIDVSRAAASELGLLQRGHDTVELALLAG